MGNIVEKNNLIAFHPGSYLEDILMEDNLTTEEFSKMSRIDIDTISNLLSGIISVDKELADRLNQSTSIDSQTWINLQKTYNNTIDKTKKQG